MFLFRFIIRFEIERGCLLCVATYQIIGAIFSTHFYQSVKALNIAYVCVLGPCTFADRPPKVFPDRHVSCLTAHFHSLRSLSIIHGRPFGSSSLTRQDRPVYRRSALLDFFTWYHIIDVLTKNSNQIVSSMQV